MRADTKPYDLAFPLGGVSREYGFSRQPNVPLRDGRYARTTPTAQNVMARDLTTGRIRGGTRPCLARYINAQIGSATGLIQCLVSVVGVGYTAPGGGGQSSESGRIVTIVAVKGGNVYVADVGGTSFTAATNDTGDNPPLNSTGVVRATIHNQKVYFFDGTHRCYYDPSLNQVKTWGASAGTFPQNTVSGAYAEIGGTWRGRLVHCIAQNWLMSAIGDATDYNFDPDTVSPTQAVAGTSSSLGEVGDIINGFVPFSNDNAVFLCDHEIWMLSGDPMAGGQLDQVSRNLGGAFGKAWCLGPDGALYFLSNSKPRVFRMTPREAPLPISQPIDTMLADINTGTYTATMQWDDELRGLLLFVTKTSGAAAAQHFLLDESTGGWFPLNFGNTSHNPLCCATIDGNTSDDRKLVIGSWDGYLRVFDTAAEDDDGTAMRSEVWLGPIQADTFDGMLLNELQAELGENSGDVSYAVYMGKTAEAALASTRALATGTFRSGRGHTVHLQRANFAVYVKLFATVPWSIEKVRATVAGKAYLTRRRTY